MNFDYLVKKKKKRKKHQQANIPTFILFATKYSIYSFRFSNDTSYLFQKTMTTMEKIYQKKRQCVEFAWLNCVKVVRPSKWNVVVKENLRWHMKNVLSNGLVLKVTKLVIYATKRLLTYLSPYCGSKMSNPLAEPLELGSQMLVDLGNGTL